ncbi:1-aminocyclopropane-1-carboxylate oxidase 2, partial [Sesamum indicum]|uniref:1-aminocyclopropane-1-carboxylate oxidase 2 n=1 Tax=Sesamum indicum TaxID=4182 RepID=A0A6I9T425_SESIN
ATATPPPLLFSDPTPSLHSSLLSAATQHGFFHLTHHTIPSHLPLSAESVAVSLFSLPNHQKQLLFPNNWPLGHEIEDDEDSAASPGAESFCLGSLCSTESITNDLDLDPLREFTGEMEELGLKVLEELASAVGFKNPARDGLQSQLWISGGTNKPGRVYPYVLGLHYQIRCQKQSLLSDSGWVSVSGQTESVLVTLGDIAQVWSNGKLKKVRGRPAPNLDDATDNPHCITMSLLITLPVDSTVFPLIPDLVENEEGGEHDSPNNNREQRLFNSFSFEDYAWRVYNERLLLKDPLIRYRV